MTDTLARDAGDTIFGQWGLKNETVVWLLSHAPDLLTETPTALRQRLVAPNCPLSAPGFKPHRMVRRPGAWKCYRHEGPMETTPSVPEIAIEVEYPPAPRLDALSKTDKMLDWQLDPRTGKRVVVETEL